MDGKVQLKALDSFECGGIGAVHHRQTFWAGEQDGQELVDAGLAERVPVTIDVKARQVVLEDEPPKLLDAIQPLMISTIEAEARNPFPRRGGRPPKQPIE
ncbi:hypothetical protein GN316_16675 [Xylophilus sp. Kf1]|nr:hypothetical protein [Xylophilus sp. Kf1]